MEESENTVFQTAWDVVNYTGINVFLTGKAGTGKTTFLRKLVKETTKKCIVIAPTGVAAINAGGVTAHSFFQLPFNPYLKHAGYSHGEVQFTNRNELIRNIRVNKNKRDLINELELLVIDEVSMLRADLLDAIDEILRVIRKNKFAAFGGVQVLFIGDLFQLPPVVQDMEKDLLKDHYDTPFFFSAEVLKENPPVIIELKKIYRQTEEKFIGLLNNIRNNTMEKRDFEMLEMRYDPMFKNGDENSITLTTHNFVADKINQDELRKLNKPLVKFHADIDGDFNDKSMPTERVLELKEGSKIMFIKNDTKGGGRYFNGKLATIIKLDQEEIVVRLSGSNIEFRVEKEKWENIKYVFNKEDNSINEHPLGSFSQYPIRLAWAITIHKSQGLTFDKMAVDAGASFAAGQVYVALSRCSSYEGLTLLTRITERSISTDKNIIEFSKRETDLSSIDMVQERFIYSLMRLGKIFQWTSVVDMMDEAYEYTATKKFEGKDEVADQFRRMTVKAREQEDIAAKFIEKVHEITNVKPFNSGLMTERVKAAKMYFIERLHEELVKPIQHFIVDYKPKKNTKQFITYVKELELDLWKKIRDIERANVDGLDLTIKLNIMGRVDEKKDKKGVRKPQDDSTSGFSFRFFKEGKTIAEIADLRNLTVSTIEGHLGMYVERGELSISEFLTDKELGDIKLLTDEFGFDNLTELKKKIGDGVSWGRLRMAVNHLRKKQV